MIVLHKTTEKQWQIICKQSLVSKDMAIKIESDMQFWTKLFAVREQNKNVNLHLLYPKCDLNTAEECMLLSTHYTLCKDECCKKKDWATQDTFAEYTKEWDLTGYTGSWTPQPAPLTVSVLWKEEFKSGFLDTAKYLSMRLKRRTRGGRRHNKNK